MKHSPSSTLLTAITAVSLAITTIAVTALYRRRARFDDEEEEEIIVKEGTLPSIIEQFRTFQLDYGSTVEEANKRRTTNYYEKSRQAHLYRVIPRCSTRVLLEKRQNYLDNLFMYYTEGVKSHRTVVVMCDDTTTNFLSEARREILAPLNLSNDITTPGCWIPKMSTIPREDMHVTVATPWWWHTMLDTPEKNTQLSQELAMRFRQALILEMHFSFQIELERIVLLGGKTLVALWRCIGERQTLSDTGETYTIYDRHGKSDDPFVRLRREIVRCFTASGSTDLGFKPLTYTHHKTKNDKKTKFMDANREGGTPTLKEHKVPKISSPPIKLRRQNTIESKTPGLGDRDGFIHTTLCRLPVDCLSTEEVHLDQVHRLCREATATLCGHRMVVSNYRFLETTGCGGEVSCPTQICSVAVLQDASTD